MLNKILYGIAVGDAVGNSLEFLSDITEYQFDRAWGAPTLRISDDTQMTLFCLQTLDQVPFQELLTNPDAFIPGYLEWYKTQDYCGPEVEYAQGLLAYKSLYHREAPGTTCMQSLAHLSRGLPVFNRSKGNGTVMRCAPIAWWAHSRGVPFSVAKAIVIHDAKTTHKHYMAWQSSVLLVGVYMNLLKGISIRNSITYATGAILDLPDGEVFADLVDRALNYKSFTVMRKTLRGFIAEDGLALALGSLVHGLNYKSVVKMAATIDGDSDTVASIAGGLAACAGMEVPAHQVERLNALDAIDYMCAKIQA